MNVTTSSVGPDVRAAVNAWFDRHEVAWELTMAALAVVYVALGFVVEDVDAAARPEITGLELGLTAFFVAEFALRFGAAASRLGYLRGHWIDVVALAPPIRGARVLRLLRLLRLVRAFAGVYRAGLHLRALARHRGFAWLIAVWLGVMALCSFGLYAAEHDVNKAIQSPFDALWWGVVTLTTVGYGDVVPTTNEGRLAAMALMLLGIVLFSAITATVTSYLLSQRVEHELEEVGDEVARAVDRSDGLASDLERLARLHAAGHLTPDEFAQAKRLVLAAARTEDL